MKSRTSFFNPTAFKKTLTRFAPVWALYTVFLLLVLFGISGSQEAVYMARDVTEMIEVTAWGNLIYAGIVAVVLFGDLYNARLCCALHAFPMRREGWLLINTVSGLLFSVIPNLFVSILASFVLGEYAYLVWIWLGVAVLQYLFFFGTAVLSAVCAGNRLAMAAIYGIIHFIVVLIYSLAELIYQPLIYGIELQTSKFYDFFPLSRMMDPYLDVDYTKNVLTYNGIVPENWVHLALCAAVGVVCGILAWLVYRRRHLERAGDFISLQPLAPVFLVIYTVAVGAIFYAFSDMLNSPTYVLLAAGLVIGFFTGMMLLKRTLRVFNKKSFQGFGLLVAVFAGSMLFTWVDPLGIGRWVPDLDKVESAAIYENSKNYVYADGYKHNRFEIKDRNELAEIQSLHRLLAESRPVDDAARLVDVRIRYAMKDGTEVNRVYKVQGDSAIGDRARVWLSDARYIFQMEDTEKLYELFSSVQADRFYWRENEEATGPHYLKFKEPEELKGLLDAILADCAAGKMAMQWAFHGDAEERYHVEFEQNEDFFDPDSFDYVYRFHSVQIYEDSTNTRAYLDKLFAENADELTYGYK